MRSPVGYHLVTAICRCAGSSKTVQFSPLGDVQGPNIRIARRPSPGTTVGFSRALPATETSVPLLMNAPPWSGLY